MIDLNLIIKKDFNQLYGILSSFMMISNQDYFKLQIEEKWNMELGDKMSKDMEDISNRDVFHKGQYLVNMEIPTRNIFINPNYLVKSRNLEEYFKYLKDQDEKDLRESIFKYLGINQIVGTKDENYISVLLEEIDKMDFSKDIKWYLISLIQDPQSYIEEFVDLIREYLPLFEELRDKYLEDYREFVQWVDRKIKRYGISFIDDHLNFINLKQYNEIHLSYSIFDLISSYSFDDDKVYIFIGLLFQKYIKDRESKDNIDKYLNAYKVLSDKTRFNILRILIKKVMVRKLQKSLILVKLQYHIIWIFYLAPPWYI